MTQRNVSAILTASNQPYSNAYDTCVLVATCRNVPFYSYVRLNRRYIFLSINKEYKFVNKIKPKFVAQSIKSIKVKYRKIFSWENIG